jgi:hypothetical protein
LHESGAVKGGKNGCALRKTVTIQKTGLFWLVPRSKNVAFGSRTGPVFKWLEQGGAK